MNGPVQLTYYSDILCIWAYVAQARLDEVRNVFGNDVAIEHRFLSVFGDARGKIEKGWKDRGGAEAYGKHVLGVANRFPHVEVHPRIWVDIQPASSTSPHLFLAALAESEKQAGVAPADSAFEKVAWAFRMAFFAEGRDIGSWLVQAQLVEPFGVDIASIERAMSDGTAFARLASDQQDAERLHIEGSPTFVLNEGRQKLYGNVGFRIVEANIREMLREPAAGEASWC